jgi:hypothetical protein
LNTGGDAWKDIDRGESAAAYVGAGIAAVGTTCGTYEYGVACLSGAYACCGATPLVIADLFVFLIFMHTMPMIPRMQHNPNKPKRRGKSQFDSSSARSAASCSLAKIDGAAVLIAALLRTIPRCVVPMIIGGGPVGA